VTAIIVIKLDLWPELLTFPGVVPVFLVFILAESHPIRLTVAALSQQLGLFPF